MKSILMSIKPYYAYLEMKRIKTVEVRKTEPKDKEWSGKVKVYVSQNKKSFNRIPNEDREQFKQHLGKVAFEFICNRIETIPVDSEAFIAISKPACLTMDELIDYCSGNDMYGLHISDLKIYDKPRELGEFKGYCNKKEECYKDIVRHCNDTHFDWKCNSITRPPQSWQYVER